MVAALHLMVVFAAVVPAHEVQVQVVDTAKRPVPGIEVLLCHTLEEPCYGMHETDAKGIAVFPGVTHSDLIVQAGRLECRTSYSILRVTTVDPSKPVPFVLADTATLRLSLEEAAADGKTKPVPIHQMDITLHPRPAQPHGAGVSRQSVSHSKARNHVDVCVPADQGFDVGVDVEGFYLASSSQSPVAPGETRKVVYSLRRKPKP